MPVYPGALEALCSTITVVQLLFTTLTRLFYKKCNRLKARVVIYAYNHHVRLLSPEPAVVDKPQSTRVEEPTLLCNQLNLGLGLSFFRSVQQKRPSANSAGGP